MNARRLLLPLLPLAALVLAGCATPATGLDPERIGVCTWSYAAPLAEVAAVTEREGITLVQLSLTPLIVDTPEAPALRQLVGAQVASGKWRVVSTMVETVGEDYSTLESIRRTGGIVPDGNWQANRERIRAAVALTQDLGCPYLSMHVGFLNPTNAEEYAKCIARVTWIRDEAARHSVTLLMETGQETAEELAAFLAAVPGVKINFDPANMVLYGKGDPLKAAERLLPWIAQVHVKDARYSPVPGEWGKETVWGEGQVRGDLLVAELERRGYCGNYVIEREGGATRAKDIAKARERLLR